MLRRPLFRILLIALSILHLPSLTGQKFMQLEKSGSLKTIRFYPGDQLVFRLVNDDKGWHTRTIFDLDITRNQIVLSSGLVVPIDSIDAISLKGSLAPQIIGGAMQAGGANMIIFSGYYSVVQDRPTDWATIGSGAANMVVGSLVRRIFKRKTFKISRRKRIRLLDTSFGPPVVPFKT